jgi:hypothetical protein
MTKLLKPDPPSVEVLFQTRLQVLEAAYPKAPKLDLTAEDTSKQQMRECFINLGAKRAHAVVGQVVVMQPLRRPTTSQQGKPNEDLADGWGSGFVQLLGAEDAALTDEEGTVCQGCRVLIGRSPFPQEPIRRGHVQVDSLESLPKYDVLMET